MLICHHTCLINYRKNQIFEALQNIISNILNMYFIIIYVVCQINICIYHSTFFLKKYFLFNVQYIFNGLEKRCKYNDIFCVLLKVFNKY